MNKSEKNKVGRKTASSTNTSVRPPKVKGWESYDSAMKRLGKK